MIRLRPGVASVCLVISAALLTHADATAAPSKPTHRAPKKRPPAPPRRSPPPPLSMLPSIARVTIDVLERQLVVVEEINLPRGEWKGEPLDFYVAFGAPGAPLAIDAHLVPVADGALEPDAAVSGEALVVDRAAHRPVSAHPLIGKETMAGVVVHLRREALSKALAPGNMAALRLRTVLELPEEDSAGARGVVVRLGASRGTPLTLGRIVLSARPGARTLLRAEAHLCGGEADGTPLAVRLTPKPENKALLPGAATATPAPIAPVLAVRHASDDLCVRFWLPP